MTPLECGIIFDGIPEGAISRKVGLIWGIPDHYSYFLWLIPRFSVSGALYILYSTGAPDEIARSSHPVFPIWLKQVMR